MTLGIISQWLPPETLRALAKEGLQMLTEPGGGGFYGKLNTQKAPLDDSQCRLALANAFTYEAALDMLAVTSEVALRRARDRSHSRWDARCQSAPLGCSVPIRHRRC